MPSIAEAADSRRLLERISGFREFFMNASGWADTTRKARSGPCRIIGIFSPRCVRAPRTG